MRKTKDGFTLVELLVVISIIAMLLAVLIPALSKARQVAYRVICMNHLRTLAVGNVIYANQNNQAYCPANYGNFKGDTNLWITNTLYRKIIDIDSYSKELKSSGVKSTDDAVASSKFSWPKKFLCPADKISDDPKNTFSNVLVSYGYNITEYLSSSVTWGTNFGNCKYWGNYADRIPQPSRKISFIDSVDWWVCWAGADYRYGWDKLHQANINDYRTKITPNIFGPVLYRHSEGANIGFYDGHTAFMKKQDIFVKEDRDASPRRPDMWAANLALYLLNREP
jgi:prepilin-type N-terminal cleavage/methylation domain-containing protein/prepilin-type processing-associated H-X9-DG protein